MRPDWALGSVAQLQNEGVLFVEDGNHGEYRPRPNEFDTQGIPFIRAADMDGGRVLFATASRINAAAQRRIRKGIGRSGDILLSHKGTVGKLAMTPLDCEPFICSPQTTFWRVLDESRLNRRFLYYYMLSIAFRRQLDAIKGETDMADYASLTAQRRFLIPIPDIGTQKAIASTLGILDDKIGLNERINETLEAMAREIFKDWFVDFGPTRAKAESRPPYLASDLWSLFPTALDDDDKPMGWKSTTLGGIAELNPSERLPKSAIAPYLDMASLPVRGLWPDAPLNREVGSGARFRNGDTLFARITPCLENGKTAFISCLEDGQIGWGSTEFVVIRLKEPFPPQYGYLLARDTGFRLYAIQSMTGTSGRQRAQVEALANYEIVYPDRSVLSAFEDLISNWFSMIAANAHETETLTQLRDLLLPKLMSGEIRLHEAEKLVGEGV